jgi:hypothetical protein
MSGKKRVLIVGLAPECVDFSKTNGLTPEKLVAGLNAEIAALATLGYDAAVQFTDAGETAERVVTERLQQEPFDCVVIGAGIRTFPEHFLLFEKLINVVHRHAPDAIIGFNTHPTDTAAAVQRWV